MNPLSPKAPSRSPLATRRRPIFLSSRATRFAAALAFQSSAAFLAVFATFGFNPRALAATYIKTATAGDLSQAASWTPGTSGTAGDAPGPGDVALFNSTITAAQTDTLTAASLAIGEIQILNPGGLITINGPDGLTLNGVLNPLGVNIGIDMSAATQSLTLAAPVTLGATQTWNIASGRTITVTGGIAGTGAAGLTKQGAGTININTTAATYTGPTTFDGGEAILSYIATTGQSNILSPSSTLVLGGANIDMAQSGTGTSADLQTVAATTLTQGESTVTFIRVSGGVIKLATGAITRNAGSTIYFNGVGIKATNQFVEVGSGATGVNTASGILGGWAYMDNVNGVLAGYAVSNGNAANVTLAAESSNNFSGNTINTSVTSSFTAPTNAATGSLLFATATATDLVLGGTNSIASGGILVTPAVGAFTSTISGGTSLTSGNGTDLIVGQFDTAGALNISSSLVDNGAPIGLTKSGGGTLILSGANTFSGTVYLNDGIVQLSNSSALGSGVNAISFGANFGSNGGELALNGFNSTVGSLSTANVYAGTPIVQNGASTAQTLTINNNGAPASFNGTIQNGGSGALNITLSGTGAQTLGGALTYTGLTTVSAGDLILTSAPATSGYVVNGTLDVTGLANSTLNLAGGKTLYGGGMVSGTVSAANNSVIAPGSSTSSTGGGGRLTIGSLSLAAGSIAAFGLSASNPNFNLVSTGALTLPGSGTVILDLYNPGASTNFATSGTFDLFQYTSLSAPANISSAFSIGTTIAGFNSAFDLSGGFIQLVLTSSGGVNALWSNGTGDGLWSDAGNWSPSVPGSPGDAATFSQSNATPGTVTLTATETLGSLAFSNSSGQGFTLTGGKTLTMDNQGHGASISVTGASTIDSTTPVSLNDNLTVSGAGTLTIAGNITQVASAESITKAGTGTLILGGANTFTGGLIVNAGLVDFAHSANSDGNLGYTGAPVSLNGGGLQWATGNTDDISSTRVITFQSGGATLDTHGNNVTLGSPVGNGGSGGLTKAGAGTLTLSASNTYTGPTTINAGTLTIGSNGALGSVTSGAGLAFNGGALDTTASFSLNNGEGTDDRTITLNSTGTLSPASGTTLTVTGAITGSGGLTVTGGGEVEILNPVANQNTYTGINTINDGSTVFLGDLNSNVNGLGSGLVILDGGTLNLYATTNNATQNGNFTNNLEVDNGFTGTLITTDRGDISGSLVGSGTLNVEVSYVRGNDDGNWSAFNGTINILNGPGTAGDEFRVNSTAGFGTASINLASGTILDDLFNFGAGGETLSIGSLSGSGTLGGGPAAGRFLTWSIGGNNQNAEFDGLIQDTGDAGAGPVAIAKVGTGDWILTDANTYSGTTTITSGTLQLGNGGATGTLPVASVISGNGTLAIDRSNAVSQGVDFNGGALAGTGGFTQLGAGTTTLTATNTYTGVTAINGGILNVGSAGALSGGGPIAFGGGILQYSSSNSLDYSTRIVNSTAPVAIGINGQTVTFASPIAASNTHGFSLQDVVTGVGSLILSASNVYSGPTTINSGAKLTLAPGGSLPNTTVTVNTGATLLALTGNGGIGSGSGSLNLTAGSTLSLVDGTIGNFTVNGGMTVGGSTVADIDLELNTDASSADFIDVTGSPVAYGSAGGLIFLTDISGTSAPTTGTQLTLINDPAGLGAASFALGTTSLTIDGQSYALSLGNSTSTSEIVTLTAASLNFYWTGQGGTSWSAIGNFATAPSGGPAQTGSLAPSSNVFLTANSPTAGNVANQTLDGNYAINSLSFTGAGTGAATTSITLGNGTGAALTIDAFNPFMDANGNNPIGTGLVVQPGSAAHLINANIDIGSSQTWNINNSPSNPLTVNGVIADTVSGSGFSLTKTGTGTLIIANADTYDGGTIINAGTVMLAPGGSLLPTGALTVTGTSTFDLAGNAQTIGNLSDGGSSGGIITSSNGAGTLTVANTAPSTYGGAINDLNGVNGSSVALVVSGASNLTLSGSSNFTGGTTLTSGNLTVANNYALGNPASANANAGLTLSPSSGAVNAFFTSANPNIASLNGNGNVILGNTAGAGSSTTLIMGEGGAAASSSGSIFSGVISDLSATNPNAVGNLEVIGGGFVSLQSANTFTGATVISGTGVNGPSEIILQVATALENSTLNYNNQGGVINFGPLGAVTLGGLTGSQALSLSNNSNTAITLTIGNHNVTSVYTGNLTGPGALVKTGTGSFTVGSGANGGANYAGNTTVNNGTLVIGGTSSITGNIDVTGNQGASNLVLADNVVVKTGTIVLVDSDDPTPGTGNPFASSLTLKNNASLTAPDVAMGNASRVAAGTFITIQDNASLTTGTLTLVNTIGSTASNDQLDLNGGTLTLDTFNLFGGANQAPTINFNGGILAAAASDSPGTVTFLGAFTNLTAKVFNGGALINTNGFDVTIAQPLTSGTSTDGGLTAMGAGGILTLTGSNSYLGATTINPGVTLQLGNGTVGNNGTITTSSGILDNGTLIYNRSGALSSGVVISGTGNVMITGAGAQTLTAANTYSGSTTIASGATLQLGNGTAGNDGTILNTSNILDNGTLAYDRSGVLSSGVAISGSGNVTMAGSGSQTLAGNNTYTGSTTVTGGTLIVSGSLAGTSAVSNTGGTHLEVDGAINHAATASISGVLEGTGSLGPVTIASGGILAPGLTAAGTAAGTLTAAGNVSFNGAGSNFSIRLGVALPTDSDQLNVTSGGIVALNDASLLLSLGSAFNGSSEPANFLYVLINNGAQSTGTGTDVFANAPASGDTILVNNTAFFNVFYAVNSTNTAPGNDIDLEFVAAIPEPSTWAELLAGAALLLIYRRSRRKARHAAGISVHGIPPTSSPCPGAERQVP